MVERGRHRFAERVEHVGTELEAFPGVDLRRRGVVTITALPSVWRPRRPTPEEERRRAGMYGLVVHYSFSPPTAAEFKALYDETGWADWNVDRFERALVGSWVVCSARDDAGRLVGLGRLISDGALHAFVTEMIVTEDARGLGMGGEIITRLVAEARRRGVEDVQLFAARGRAGFYERHGFERRPESGPGMDLADVR